MPHTSTSSQIPQHVNALLSHLTSRPGVQSTFILSRKDGSIIQSTGLYASPPPPAPSSSSISKPTDQQPTSQLSEGPQPTPAGTDPPSEATPTTIPLPESGTSTPQPYQPSQAETLAANIFAFVSGATTLSGSLSHPPVKENESAPSSTATTLNGARDGGAGAGEGGTGAVGREEGDGDGSGKEEEGDDVKLLRFRSKKHEVVVVPDRKYILCVVHDAASPGSGGSAGGGRGAR